MATHKFHYFAYGSNMLTARLLARCPSAVVIGSARAENYTVSFSKQGRDLSGKATLTNQEGTAQTGIVFEISQSDLASLDRAEGPGYRRDNEFATTLNTSGEQLICKTYIARQTVLNLRPFDWYLALIIAGAREHQLADAMIRAFQSVASIQDPQTDRAGRIEALAALQRAGHADPSDLLKR